MGLFRRAARARLAAQVMRRLRRAGATGVRYASSTFTVRFVRPSDDQPSVLRLDEIGRGGRARIDQFVAGFLRAPGVPAAWAQARPFLRPVLRGAGTGGHQALLHRPALPFLSEFVVVDQPDTMTFVEAAHGWGVTDEEIFAAARENLSGARLLGEASEQTVVHFHDDGDAYWTSHLLLDGWLAALEGQVGGRPVAFAPERGTLLVVADGSELLPAVFARAEEIYLTSARPISPMAYCAGDDGKTIVYGEKSGKGKNAKQSTDKNAQDSREQNAQDSKENDAQGGRENDAQDGRENDAQDGRVRRARAILACREYADQAARLTNAAELVITADGRTRALWPDDSPTLLPEADEIHVGKDRVVAWSEVEKTPQGLYPERWRVERHPPR